MKHRSYVTRILLVACLSFLILACQRKFISKGKKTSKEIPDTSAVLSEWNEGKITENNFEKRLESIPAFYRPKGGFSTQQKQKFLEKYAIEDIFYLEALKKGTDKSQTAIDFYKKSSIPVILNQYNKNEINDKTSPTDSDLKKFYEKNKDSYFTKTPTANILHIQTSTSDSANEAISELKKGADFPKVVDKYSNNKYTKKKGGKLTDIRKGAYIAGIGKSPGLDSLIFSAKLNKLYGPVRFKDHYHIIKVIERDTILYKPFDKNKKDVERRYRSEREKTLKENLVNNLIKKYKVTIDTLALKNIDLAKADTCETEANIQLIKTPIKKIAFTAGDFAKEMKEIPGTQKQTLDTYKGKKQFVERKLNNNVMYYDALKKGYEQHPEIKDKLSRIKKIAALREYYKETVVDSASVSEEEIKKVYEKEKEKKYMVQASSRIQQFVFNDKKTAENVLLKAKNAKTDKDLNSLVEQYSLDKAKNGIIGPIYESGTTPGLGKDPEYVKKIFSTSVGKFSDVFQNKKSNYVFFKVLSHKPTSYKKLEELSSTIKASLSKEKEQQRFAKLKDKIVAKHNLKLYPEKLEKKLSVDSLYKLAENAMTQKRFSSAIGYYNQIIKYYKNGKDDYKATFMKGFIYSEDLNNKAKAQEMFNQVLTYPEGELHESAKYMLKALKGDDKVLQKINKAPEKAIEPNTNK